jgi:hypothetical protein
MAKKAPRLRVDWMPGPAACDALEIGEQLLPHLGRQAVIDKLLICGLHALRQSPPVLWGHDRDEWALPPGLALPKAVPGNPGPSPQQSES